MRTCILICVVCILACPQADARWLDGAKALTVTPGAQSSGIGEAGPQRTAATSVLVALESVLFGRYHYVTPGVAITGQHPVPHRYHYVTRGLSLTGQLPGFGLSRSPVSRS